MRYRVHKIAPMVPTASMADIAFLLIIFFMLTTSFSPEKTNVTLPASTIQTKVTDGAAIIAIKDTGELWFTDGEEQSQPISSAEEIGRRAGAIVEQAPTKEFLVKADRNVPFVAVDEVLEALRTNQVRNIGLLTRLRARKVN